MKKILLPLVLLVGFAANCATSSAGIATSNIPIANKKYKVISPVDEKISWWTFDIAIIGFPFNKPPIDELVSKVLKAKEADALVNIRYWNDRSVIFFMSLNRFGLTAEAVKFEEEVVPANEKKKR